MRVRREKELKPASVREEDKDSSDRVDEVKMEQVAVHLPELVVV